MKGDLVILRSYNNIPLVRRVWDVGEECVYLCNEERYAKLLSGKTIPLIIGFPMKDVFEFDNTIPLEEINGNPKVWESLSHWKVKNFEYA